MPDVQIYRADGVIELTLSNPQRRNAVNRAMIEALGDALVDAENDRDIRAVLLTGTGTAFCSGADVGGDILDHVAEMETRMRSGINRIVKAMRDSRLPIVVAVNGAAAGGGVGFALSGDIVLAARSAYFVQSFVDIGLTLDCGLSMLVQRAIGAPRARALALLGERLSAEDAERWGLIWRCVADEELMVEARTITRHLASGPPIAVAKIKHATEAGWNSNFTEGVEREVVSQAEAFLTEDLREGVLAFQAKRSPVFKGR